MKKIKINRNDFSLEDIERVANSINSGEVVVLPTDTIYGLSCLADSKKSVERIYRIKKRSKEKPMIVLVKSFCMLRKYCFLSKRQYQYLKDEMNKNNPITVILKKRKSTLKKLPQTGNSIAIRIPTGSKLLMAILKKINRPIVSTSLNFSGEVEIKNLKKLENYFKKTTPDLIVDGGVLLRKKASKVVDIRDIEKIEILRE